MYQKEPFCIKTTTKNTDGLPDWFECLLMGKVQCDQFTTFCHTSQVVFQKNRESLKKSQFCNWKLI